MQLQLPIQYPFTWNNTSNHTRWSPYSSFFPKPVNNDVGQQPKSQTASTQTHIQSHKSQAAIRYGPLLGGAKERTLGNQISAYISLSKPRLSALVLVSTGIGYLMTPGPVDGVKFTSCCVGTGLAITAANTYNQFIEIPRDAKMSRTTDRVLPSSQITPNEALVFAALCTVGGTTLLASRVNFSAAALALVNIGLYGAIYTPLKVIHPINTWVGSVVGAIPLLIGWVGATGEMSSGGWALFALQYIWQIPHFLALSWNLRTDYEKGGYKMLSNVDPKSVAPQCLYWSLLMLPVGPLCSWAGFIDRGFAFDSTLLNGTMVYYAWKYYKEEGNENNNARALFKCTIFHLLALYGLMGLHKALVREPVIRVVKNLFSPIFGKWISSGIECTCDLSVTSNAPLQTTRVQRSQSHMNHFTNSVSDVRISRNVQVEILGILKLKYSEFSS
ncbi:protoheme IX farnesyltransferase, mitochondrial-like [Planoprotostelium fungivorum]|uniref:Heme O synthase n=1 Tax=Planoprotostelium fungivorum TaxID=1890364 RepID=A0A2P6NEN5_9EUKA|nr:protoheme IX farnesyltransferase, mitochondrial-like [Planoprotostelium fungivorum]